jgi:succinate dehydrogenase / fumarate reductase, cytochrome b subunit
MSDPAPDLATSTKKPRPEFRNINAFTDLTTYRMTAGAWVSILHRASGAIMFLLLPLIVWIFEMSIKSDLAYNKLTSLFGAGIGFMPGWFFKLMALGLIWAYLHHLCAGIRHLWMDVSHTAVTKTAAKTSAALTLVISLTLTALLAAKLFGLIDLLLSKV